MQISTSLKIRKIAQLQETIIFTCNPIKNENTHHELPKDMYNPKQDRNIWVIKISCFPCVIIVQHFCKMTHSHKQSFYLKILAKPVVFPSLANIKALKMFYLFKTNLKETLCLESNYSQLIHILEFKLAIKRLSL